jgi:tRNA modification GTPase
MWSSHELIVAPATVPGQGMRSIVRLAGDGLERLLPLLFVADGPGFAREGERPRVVGARFAADGLGSEWGELAVEILHWPGPAGPIGGPLAEVQLPCSQPLVDAVIAEACRQGARLARGGEFTLRAFLSGRLDLVQAEAVLAVVDARTPGELAHALDRMAAGAGGELRGVRAGLLDLLADIEAAIDFADEATPDAVPVPAAASWRPLAARLAQHRAAVAAAAARLAGRAAGAADVPRVVLVGRPNIGKSSLFNRLVGRDAALVADEAGTTRDWIATRLDAADARTSACLLVDLAGLPADDLPPRDAVDAAAIEAANGEIARADVIVACRDAGDPPPTGAAGRGSAVRIEVITRCDLAEETPGGRGDASAAMLTSSRTGRGVEDVRAAIFNAVACLPPRGSPATLRMGVGLAAAGTALEEAVRDVTAAAGGAGLDEALVASHVRRAVDALGEVTGAEIGTDLLDRIFSRHCIGK